MEYKEKKEIKDELRRKPYEEDHEYVKEVEKRTKNTYHKYCK